MVVESDLPLLELSFFMSPKIPVMMATDTEPQIVITATCTVASNDENHAILLHLTQNISASSCQTAAVLRPMPSVRQLLICRFVQRRRRTGFEVRLGHWALQIL